MELSRRMRVLITSLIVVFVLGMWAFSYHTFEFKGGVGIRDSGFFSYPRYHARLGELPLWKDGEHSFTVHGLPPGPLDLTMQVRDSTNADRAELMSLPTSVSVSITESNGRQICTASGGLSNAGSGDRSGWVLASSASGASFWQSRCLDLPISRFRTYTVKVGISGANERSSHKMLVPVLQGGGNELP